MPAAASLEHLECRLSPQEIMDGYRLLRVPAPNGLEISDSDDSSDSIDAFRRYTRLTPGFIMSRADSTPPKEL